MAATMPPTFTAPSNLTAAAASSSQINLSWTAGTETGGTITQYLIERCSGAGCSNFVQVSTSATATFNDTGLTASTSYSYRVRATDASSNFSGYSAAATASTNAIVVSVSISPKRAAITTGQAQSFLATVTGSSNVNVTWMVDSIPGGNSTVGMIDVNGKYTPPATGAAHVVTATSVADPNKTATVTVAVTDLPGVFTYHNNLSRDGANTKEYALTTTSVTGATFGKLFSCAVDGAIYAQPLWVANVMISGAKHNVVFVATMHDSIYAFDADANANPCVPLWHATLTDTTHGGQPGETSVAGNLVGSGFGDIQPEVGITSTPVIDPGTGTLYALSKSTTAGTAFFQRLHALDLSTGLEKFGGPTSVTSVITSPGNFDGGTTVAFDPRNEGQRPGLALVNGVVYVAWASHEDHDPYHGWVMGFDAGTLKLVPNAVFNTTPNVVGTTGYARGGIWMGGGAPAADSNNNLYVLTGNGTFDANNAGGANYADSTLKLSTSAGLAVADWFTPADQANIDGQDADHGSGGAAILVSTATKKLVIGGGKAGYLFLLDQSVMGHYGATSVPPNAQAVQIINAGNSIFSTAAFWNNSLYIAPVNVALEKFPFDPVAGTFKTGSATSANVSFGFPGATPSVSASGTTNGIVWEIDSSQYCTAQAPVGGCKPATLYAFDAANLLNQLWNSNQIAADAAGFAVKFTVPTVANGKVYIGTRGNDTGAGTSSVRGELDVYGLKPN
jgi:hypothetical protein